MSGKAAGRVADKVAIVTGGASGIGAAICRLFAREGAHVMVADLQSDNGVSLAEEIRKSGGSAEFVRADVSRGGDVDAMVAATVSRFGRLDILVANAGIENTKREVDTSEEEWDQIMDVNAKGVFLCSKYAIPEMKKNGGGSAGYAAYHATKGAVRTFTKGTAIAHAREGIRANSIHPGAIDTPLLQSVFASMPDPEAARARYVKMEPVGRLGRPEDIAFGALYLASDESAFVTGIELVIDGGLIAQ
jgi:cyclopentanol dehydrogenase